MPKPKIPNQRKAQLEHKKRIERYVALIDQLYDKLNKEASKLALATDHDPAKQFLWSDYPQTKAALEKLQSQYISEMSAIIMAGTSAEWKESNIVQDLVAKKLLKAYTGTTKAGEEYTRYFETNPASLQAFQKRKTAGMGLSTRVWNLSEQYKTELEMAVSAAIEPGTSAMELAADIKKYLNEPDMMFRRFRYKDENGEWKRKWKQKIMGGDGKVHFIDADPKEYHPGRGVYRSSARNAQRLARTEINMSYRTAEQERWRQFDFVVGYEVKTTQNGRHVTDICDCLAGKYRKDFKFLGWHPACYEGDMEVLTNAGWKQFKDVSDDDLIMSLNPETRALEYVSIADRQCYDFNGDLVRFFNKSLDCAVTPEHRMVYLNKGDGRIKYCPASEFRMTMGAFYRGAMYDAEEREWFEIEGRKIRFDDYCAFMGYYLSDGSLQSGTGVTIAQQAGRFAFYDIANTIAKMGYNISFTPNVINIYNSALNRYLSQFGTCLNKYIPNEIKTASKRQIQIFLDAFIKCDGHTRKCKSFVGNHGNTFHSDKEERMYFTTSERLAGDLSELILKVGHRPSFEFQEPKTAIKKDGSIIKSNYLCYRIRECYSTTATVFKKELMPYSGKVYDLTLERNHIMYVRRNGKCFWGSNCMCYSIPILKTEDEFFDDDTDAKSVNEIEDVPQGFKDWIKDNKERIDKAAKKGTLPYFIRDNRGEVDKILHPEKEVGKSNSQTKSQLQKLPLNPTQEDIENFINTIARNEGWFSHYDDGVSIILDDKLRGAVASASRENATISLKPSESLLNAFYRISNKEELTYENANNLATIWHEINHMRHVGIDKATGGPYKGGVGTSAMELANEYYSRKTLPDFFKTLGYDEMPFPNMVNRRNTGYNKMVELYDYAVRRKFGLDENIVLRRIEHGLFQEPYNNQVAVLMDALKQGGLRAKDSQIEKLVLRMCQYGKEPNPDKLNDFIDKMKYSIELPHRISESAFDKSINKVRKNLIRQDREKMYILNSKGSVIAELTGDSRSISFDDNFAQIAKNNIVTHNHPSGKGMKGLPQVGFSLSLDDVVEAVKCNMKGIVAESPSYRYSMMRNGNSWNMSVDEIRQEYQEELKRLKSYYSDQLTGYRQIILQHLIMKNLSKKYGFNYTHTKI